MNLTSCIPLIASVIVVSGSLITAYFSFMWAERTRQLDLYKVVFPEKMKAAKEIMEAAQNLSHSVFSYSVLHQYQHDVAARDEVIVEAVQFGHLISTQGWILGGEVDKAGGLYAQACRFFLLEPKRKDKEDGKIEFPERTNMLERQLHSPTEIDRIVDTIAKHQTDYHAAYTTLSAAVRKSIHTAKFENLFKE